MCDFFATLQTLFKKGVRYSTVIDIGCADGNFFLNGMNLFAGAVPLHIDANSIYEASLSEIKSVVGGDYRIVAVSDRPGEIEMTEAAHPYWSSLRPQGDAYWSRINDLRGKTTTLPTVTLDGLVSELGMKPPFLLKMDVQGAEMAIIKGAASVLKETSVVICEADIDDFQDLNSALLSADFSLYDLTTLHRVSDGSLGWFYPVYVSNRLADVRPDALWDTKDNQAVIDMQIARRNAILQSNAKLLNRIRYGASKIGRNENCPCGSGLKFKHCCGSFAGLA